MYIILIQAAAEYVGVTIVGFFQAMGNGLRSVGDSVEDNPLITAGVVVLILLMLRALGRRRR